MENLKKLRELKRLTQVDMCKLLNISLSTYRIIEYGAQKPSQEIQSKLEKILYE